MAPRGELDTFLNDILAPRLASCKNKLRKTLLAFVSSGELLGVFNCLKNFCWVGTVLINQY